MTGRRIRKIGSARRKGSPVMLGLLILLLPVAGADAVHAKRHARRKRPMPTPSIRTKPPQHTTQRAARFTFTDKEHGVTLLCSLDGSKFKACPYTQRYGPIPTATSCPKHAKSKRARSKRGKSKKTRSKPCKRTIKLKGRPLSLGRHTFRVRARGRKGRLSRPAFYTWTIEAPATTPPVPSLPGPSPPPSPVEGHDFSISTTGSGGDLYPGGPAETIPLTLYNPNDEPLYVTSLTVAVSKSPAGCEGATNLSLTQSSASPEKPVLVPANGSVTLPAQGVSAPTVQLVELPANQDACKGATFALRYTGSAHS